VLSATIAVGYPWADVPEVGASVIVVTNNDHELAQTLADDLGDWIWENRLRWYSEPKLLAGALAEGELRGAYPIILADQADNPGGGAPGDTTDVLQKFIDLGLQNALVLYLVDPAAAQAAHAAGAGTSRYFELGGKSHPAAGPPVCGEFEIVAVSDGSFVYDGPMYAGVAASLGASAWLRQQGVSVVVVSERVQPIDLALCRTLGLDCREMRYIAVKSAQHFRSGFEAIAGSIFTVDARGLLSHDFSTLPYVNRSRPMFPVEIRPEPECQPA
jgi:microcystin degradation protein MlrC